MHGTGRLGLREVNAMSVHDFVAALGGVFEHSPWIAERTFAARPFADVGALHAAMVAAVRDARPAEQLALLCAHPELAGREAQAGTLTDASTAEQKSAGLSALNRAEMERIAELNHEYRAKHGFPFIIAVRNYDKAGIFAEFERRLGNATTEELANCLAQVYAITRLRLDAMIEAQSASEGKS
jgi:2-oxo-4-hydroxy-4-carboxy-5-ureidoimidazoline decarboxylase